ncbi:MAG: TFIIB-type zinc ribbon-containing protein [Candidatus Aenigmatarchaeota archaeon]
MALKNEESVNGKCSECGAEITREPSGEMVCAGCGLVVEQALFI